MVIFGSRRHRFPCWCLTVGSRPKFFLDAGINFVMRVTCKDKRRNEMKTLETPGDFPDTWSCLYTFMCVVRGAERAYLVSNAYGDPRLLSVPSMNKGSGISRPD